MTTKTATALATGAPRDVARKLIAQTDEQLRGAQPALVVAMASIEQPLAELMPLLAAAYPDSVVLGCSTAGEFTQSGAGDGATSLFALAGDFKVFAGFASGLKEHGERAVAQALASLPREQEDYPYKTGLLFVDAFAQSGEETTLLAASILGADVPLAGGAAGDGLRLQNLSWVGCGAQSGPDALVAAMIFSKTPIGMGVRHGHIPLTEPLRVTRAEGSVVCEIGEKPAFQVWDELTRNHEFRKQTNIRAPGPDGMTGFFATYQLGLTSGSEYKIRAPFTVLDQDAMAFACGVPEGAEIRIMQTTEARQIESARQAAKDALSQLGERRPAGALVFDCACRKTLLGDRFPEAVAAIRQELDVPLAGFESYGEIALRAGDMSGFHNTTTVLLVFS